MALMACGVANFGRPEHPGRWLAQGSLRRALPLILGRLGFRPPQRSRARAHVPDAAVTVQLFRLPASERLTSAAESPPLCSGSAKAAEPRSSTAARPPTPSRPRRCPGEAARGRCFPRGPVGLLDRKAFPAGQTGELAGGGQAGASGRLLCAPGFQPRPERAGSAWVRRSAPTSLV